MRPLPPLFATRRSPHVVDLWDSHLLEQGSASSWERHWSDEPPVYRITPHTVHTHSDPLLGRPHGPPGMLLRVDTPPHRAFVSLVADPIDDRPFRQSDIVYRGPWKTTPCLIHSWYHGTPIPLLEFDAEFPTEGENRMRIEEVDHDAIDIWFRRWRPDLAAGGRRRSPARGADGGISQPPPTQPTQQQQPVPKFVADALIADAVRKGATCPITLDPLETATAAATTCYHVFQANAIASWLAMTPTCPTCKASCRIVYSH